MKRSCEKGVKKICNIADIKSITKGKVTIREKWNEKEVSLESDSVIIAMGSKPSNDLFANLVSSFPKIFQIGDCKEPRTISEAIHEAFYVANRV